MISPSQKAQIQLRLAAVAAERAIEHAKEPPATVKPSKPVTDDVTQKRVGRVKSGSDAPKRVGRATTMPDEATSNAARCARKRAAKGDAHKAAEAERKRQARAAKKSA